MTFTQEFADGTPDLRWNAKLEVGASRMIEGQWTGCTTVRPAKRGSLSFPSRVCAAHRSIPGLSIAAVGALWLYRAALGGRRGAFNC